MTGMGTKLHITVSGVVQGVGFRSFVYNLAKRYGLFGCVGNENGTVEIEVQGGAEAVSSFVDDLELEAPPASQILSISTRSEVASHCQSEFKILPSSRAGE